MKKIISIVLALIIMMSAAIPTFAATSATTRNDNSIGVGDYDDRAYTPATNLLIRVILRWMDVLRNFLRLLGYVENDGGYKEIPVETIAFEGEFVYEDIWLDSSNTRYHSIWSLVRDAQPAKLVKTSDNGAKATYLLPENWNGDSISVKITEDVNCITLICEGQTWSIRYGDPEYRSIAFFAQSELDRINAAGWVAEERTGSYCDLSAEVSMGVEVRPDGIYIAVADLSGLIGDPDTFEIDAVDLEGRIYLHPIAGTPGNYYFTI